ncbi:CPL domain containing protein [Aphelenchoides bicaudatus]|nr:CPL domain containing protein [Aphelenchoides bicaudatus]
MMSKDKKPMRGKKPANKQFKPKGALKNKKPTHSKKPSTGQFKPKAVSDENRTPHPKKPSTEQSTPKAKQPLRVTKSVKEQLLQMDKKQRKQFLRELREKKKPQFKDSQKFKAIWEKLRSSKTSDSKKEELAQQLWESVKGSSKQFIYAHDTSRVLQSLLTHGTADIRNDLFDELTPELIRMAKSEYAKFFVIKMLKNGSKRQRDVIISAMFGHFASLIQMKTASKIVELIFNDYATARQRFEIVSEFYGKEFVLFRGENNFQSLKEIHEKSPEKIELIMKNVEGVLRNLADKEQFKLSICHKLLSDFFVYCTSAQKLEMIDLIKERLPEICHSKEGSDVCIACISNTNAKDRKLILKSFKGLAVKSALDQYARRVLFSFFDTVDDTILLNKTITKEIADNIADVIYDKWGNTVLHYIVHPRNPHVFSSGGLIEILKQGDGNEHSKKSPAERYKQIFDALKESLYTFMAANMKEILYNKTSAVLVLNSLEPTGEGEIMIRDVDPEQLKACFESIAELAAEEYVPHDNLDENKEKHLMQGGPGRFVFKKLLKVDKNQPTVKLSEYVATLPKDQLSLFAATNSGCFDLLHMCISGSEKARNAVRDAVNISSLKKKTGYPGAQYLLEEVSNSVRALISNLLTLIFGLRKYVRLKRKSDPSVRQATQQNTTTEEYNPFQNASSQAASTTPQSTAINMSSDELFRQQEELRKREQDLQRRQQEFERRQNQTGGGSRSQNPHNWPPLPGTYVLAANLLKDLSRWSRAFIRQVVFFINLYVKWLQDIDVEIPSQFQETVRLVYYVFLVYTLALTINVVASLFYFLFAGGGLGIFFLSCIQLILFTPCAFLFWFRPVYKAFRDDSSFNFMVFFFVLFFHSIFTLVQALGLSHYACGWSNTISVFSVSIFVGIIMLASALAFTASFGGMVVSLLKVHRLYRGAGFTLDKARKEFSDSVMSDRNVQSAVNQAGRAAANAAVNNAANQFSQGRY